jgi:hypothetical protein
VVHRYDPAAGAWVAKPPSAGRASAVDSVAGVVYAETSSFSLYSALAAPALPAASTGTTTEAETTPGAAGTPVYIQESTWLRDVVIIASTSGGVALLVFCLCAVWIYRNPPRRAKVQLKQPPTPAPPQAAGLEGLHPGAPAGGVHPAAHPAMQESGAARMATAGPTVAPADLEVSLPPQHQARPRPSALRPPATPPGPLTAAARQLRGGTLAADNQAPATAFSSRRSPPPAQLAAAGAARNSDVSPFAHPLRQHHAQAAFRPPARPLPAPARAPTRAGC